ncbi:MAG: regX [Chloroflexi bacterium]|nr:regX [Chloroflexota bacterium]
MKALVVDDDRVLADLVAFTLRREGFQVVQAHDGENALKRWAEEQPDIVILDVNLPKTVPSLDGFTICQRIRAVSDTPIILLTVREDEEDIIYGFKAGADDYIHKPFSPRQLVARVEAILRRSSKVTAPVSLQCGELSLDPSRREVRLENGNGISLTALESRLLEYFMLHPGHILAMQDLIDHIWGPGGGDRDMLRQLVRRLRAKIEPDPANPIYIETVPGFGYGLRRPASQVEN